LKLSWQLQSEHGFVICTVKEKDEFATKTDVLFLNTSTVHQL